MHTPARSGLATTLVLILGPSVAAGADLGIPRDGRDRVLLDDGRVVDARVLPREGEIVPLEFAAGTIRVHKSRVREVRSWKDFDPAPRDEGEKARTSQGQVRWNGVLVPAARAEKLRAEEVEKERKLREAAEIAGTWENRLTTGAGKFSLFTNGSKEDLKYWGDVLAALSRKMIESFPGADMWSQVHVHLYRDEASLAVQRAEDAKRPRRAGEFSSPWDPDQRIDVVMGGRSREELLPAVLCPAAIKLFHEMMGWQVDDMGGWVRFGVPLYFASSSIEKGTLRVGEVNDALLYRFRRMAADGRLPKVDDVLRAGNSYWKETGRFDPGRIFGFGVPGIEAEYVPYTWLLVHFMLHGDGGKYRGGLTNWVKYWMTAKIGSKRVETAGSYKDQRALLLRYLKLSDLEPLVGGLKEYAEGLKYRRPATYVFLASKAMEEEQDASAALAHIETAWSMAKGDATTLRDVGEACAAIPGAKGRAAEILRASVDADPLSTESRLALARVLEGADGERERLLGEALRGEAAGGARGE